MGYSHYWYQKRPFTNDEWEKILAEAKRICAKAQRGLYAGKEDFASSTKVEQDEMGFRHGFNEPYAWRTFAHPEAPTPMQDQAITLANWEGKAGTRPTFSDAEISFNGVEPDGDYETFRLQRSPESRGEGWIRDEKKEGIFNCCKTEYRPYDAVVVSILHVARTIAPEAIRVSSDGGNEAIKLMF